MHDDKHDATVDESTYSISVQDIPIHLEFINSLKTDVDSRALAICLAQLTVPNFVEGIFLSHTSRLESLPFCTHFPNLWSVGIYSYQRIKSLDELQEAPKLRRLSITSTGLDVKTIRCIPSFNLTNLSMQATRKTEVDVISQCDQLHHLKIEKWRESDVSPLLGMPLDTLDFSAGRLETIEASDAFNLSILRLASQRKLTRIHSIAAEKVMSLGCNKLHLPDLANVRGMKKLLISEQHDIDDLSFIADCASLEKLDIVATRITQQGLDSFTCGEKLKEVYASDLPGKDGLAKLSKRYPHLCVRDFGIIYKNGKVVAGN